MSTDPARRRLGVRFDERVWADATRGFSRQSLNVATSARRTLEEQGIALEQLLPCQSPGPDGTQLSGCAKLYLPVGEEPPSQRPFAFVLQLARDVTGDLVFVFVAFGPRHPGPGVRTVYERAHRQLHGRFPGQR
jgi:hypothetical protein